jgi:hypothetical protein
MKTITAVSMGVALLLAGLARAGVYLEYSELDVASGKLTPRHKVFVQQGQLRMESVDGHTIALFRDNSMILLDPAGKSYRVLDKAAMDQVAGRANDAMAAMQSRLASLSPEQRAALERAMPGMAASVPGAAAAPQAHTLDAQDTGTSGSAGGRSCHLWNALRDGKPTEQLCVVPTTSLPGMGEVEESLKAAAAFSASFQESMRARGGPVAAMGSGVGGALSQNLSLMGKIGGMPVAARRYDSATGALAATESVLTQWQQRSLDASQFEIPAGYVRKDFMGGRQPQ